MCGFCLVAYPEQAPQEGTVSVFLPGGIMQELQKKKKKKRYVAGV